MKVICLVDTPLSRKNYYPFSLTRPIGTMLYGLFSVAERYQLAAVVPVHCVTEPYLQQPLPDADQYLCIDATLFPFEHLLPALLQLEAGEALLDAGNRLLAWCTHAKPAYDCRPEMRHARKTELAAIWLDTPWDLLRFNDQALRTDLEFLTKQYNRASGQIYSQVIGPAEHLYVEEGAEVLASTINCSTGPVVIRKGSLVMEGVHLRGPVVIGEGAVVKMGACIYGATTIGKQCTVGGEIKNSIVMDYSNKAHEGYLGDSLVGSWCNLGAGTSVSNVRNTGGKVPVWSEASGQMVPAGIKAGLLMGDFSRSAINTPFNTGTVVGASSSIHQRELPPKHIPSLKWGNSHYLPDKAIEHIANWKKLKGHRISETDMEILRHLSQITQSQ